MFNDFPAHGDLYVPGPAGGPSVGETIRKLVQTDAYWTNQFLTGTTTVTAGNGVLTNTMGNQYLSLLFKPLRAENLLRITASIICSTTASAGTLYAMLFVNSETNCRTAVPAIVTAGEYIQRISLDYDMVAGTQSPILFTVRAGCNVAATTQLNHNSGANYGGSFRSIITVEEYETIPGARS